jgi:hypothetical protein
MWMVAADRPTKFRGNGIDKTTIVNTGTAPDTIVIGSVGSQSTETSDWAVSEIIVYTSTLSDADVKAVENYLMLKYLNSVPDFVDLNMTTVLNTLYNRTTTNPLTTGSLLELYRDNGAVTTNIESMPAYGTGTGTVSLISARYLYRNPLLFRLSATNLKLTSLGGIANGGAVTTWGDEINKYSATTTGTTYLQYDAFYQYHYLDMTGANYITVPSLTLSYRNHKDVPIQGFTVVAVAKFNNTGSWARLLDFGNGQQNNNLVFARTSTSNTLTLQMYNGSSLIALVNAVDAIDLNLHVWTAVVDNVALTMSLYKDGVLLVTAAMNALINRTITTNYLGKSNWTTNSDAVFNGRIVDFDFYSQPLTTGELLAVHTYALKRYAIALPLMPGLMYRVYNAGRFNVDTTYFTTNAATNTGTTNNIRNLYDGTEGVKGSSGQTNYSVEWFGYFRATATGTWTFHCAADDYTYMWVGATASSGNTSANAFISAQYNAVLKSNTISLTAGEYYPIRVQYGQGSGGAACQVAFTPPGGTLTYDGTGYYFTGTGFSSLYPGLNAASLKAITNVNVDGNFWLLVNGTSTSTFCAMSTI